MAPAQLVVFIEKQAEECMTASPSEEKNWSRKRPAPCALVVKGQSILLRTWWTLYFSLPNWNVLKSGLAKKDLLLVRALVVKGQSILLRTWTLRPDNALEPVHHQNRTKRGSCANYQRWGALACIDHFQVFCQDYSHPWNTNSGDFHPDRSGGHVVPRWKSPLWLWLIVCSGENHPRYG